MISQAALRLMSRYPPELATRDHLHSRIAWPAGRPQRTQGHAVVLACLECNQGRACAEQDGRDWVPPLMRARRAGRALAG
jgi:hypothetical protein